MQHQSAHPRALDAITSTLENCEHVVAITGAGISTSSGISDYRDQAGAWKRPQPVQHQAFMQHLSWRQRYWARSQLGYPEFMRAQPNAAHRALVTLEQSGKLVGVITQNVDRLHQRAGQQRVLDLHGRLDQVRCMACEQRMPRDAVQIWLQQHNAWVKHSHFSPAPDGDADIELEFGRINVPECSDCGGLLKPDVVFFGDTVPKADVQQGYRWIEEADAVLVVGSSLMVYSSFRFVRRAHEMGKPIVAINQGKTRADDLFLHKANIDCAKGLAAIAGSDPGEAS
ncbi:MAG: NAD-dependent protein deacetylase [Gammaproteobacteria bacterium TMED92]|nr:MAG: NAD-dependent protein deacetylase [Gammaproteobacteria bacterium TMED92]